jgi:hypothetical protein
MKQTIVLVLSMIQCSFNRLKKGRMSKRMKEQNEKEKGEKKNSDRDGRKERKISST